MKNKKGFTLIELLAVIVILAIIALIATPIILNMINDARKNSAKSSALGYIDAIEYNNGFAQLGTTDISGTYEEIKTGDVTTANQKLGNHLKGKAPTSGTVTIDTKGKVTAADFCINGYNVTYDGKDATVNGKCNGSNNNNNNEPEPAQTGGPTSTNVGDLVYFDPVSTNTCDNEHTTGSTCYKWRIISKDENNLTVQMDHNLVNLDKWSTDSSNISGPGKALSDLATATSTWTRVDPLNYEYDSKVSFLMTCNDGICTKQGNNALIAGTSEVPVRARIITGEEIKVLTLNAGAASNSLADKWSAATSDNSWYYFSNSGYTIGTQTSGTNNKALAWLVENTSDYTDSGATANTYGAINYGYWTLTMVSVSPIRAWCVGRKGFISGADMDDASYYGLRPVITMPKSVFRS